MTFEKLVLRFMIIVLCQLGYMNSTLYMTDREKDEHTNLIFDLRKKLEEW